MKTMQEKLLGVIEQRITEAGLEPTISTEWANRGRVFAMDGLATVLWLSYDFQTDHATFEVNDIRVEWAIEANILPAPGGSATGPQAQASPGYMTSGSRGPEWHVYARYDDGMTLQGFDQKLAEVLEAPAP